MVTSASQAGRGAQPINMHGFSPVAFPKELRQIEALLIVEAMGAPIVEDQQLETGACR